MMRQFISIVSAYLVFALSPIPVAAFTGPTAFRPLVDQFVAEGRAQGVPDWNLDHSGLTMQFGTTEGNVIGLCYSGAGMKPLIVISQKFWDESGATSRMLVVHHELGHCVLDRRHREETFTNGNPVSMMYPIILYPTVYSAYRDYYEREMYERFVGSFSEDEGTCAFRAE